MAQLAAFRIPAIENEPVKSYAPSSTERKALHDALKSMRSAAPHDVPCVINGEEIRTGKTVAQPIPSDHAVTLANAHQATPELVQKAIDGALEARKSWSTMPWADRAAIFLKAADLVATKYRADICAATMLGQGKNIYQAEIDAAAELVDFLRFGVKYVEELYAQQPPKNAPGVWNRVEYRPLEGFVFAVTPFNFTAIAGNLNFAPIIMGNVTVWKPSPMAAYSGYLISKIFTEAGLPAGVMQFLPGDAESMCEQVFAHPMFAALHFTGSTKVFKKLWKDIGNNIDTYRSYPRIVGETGGKNFHLVHPSADLKNAVLNTIRGAFEYQGQKCSACSRLYVPSSLWTNGFKDMLVSETGKITSGAPEDFEHFMGPVISKASFDKVTGYISKAKGEGAEILVGGQGDDTKGFFVKPTVILSKDVESITMREEIFGPVLTVYVYEDKDFEKMCGVIDQTSIYALTGAIFAQDRAATVYAARALDQAAGNFYINDKCTGAVVGQQPFGGSRGSGTNDKAGSINIFYRFVNARSIKENFGCPDELVYPSNVQGL